VTRVSSKIREESTDVDRRQFSLLDFAAKLLHAEMEQCLPLGFKNLKSKASTRVSRALRCCEPTECSHDDGLAGWKEGQPVEEALRCGSDGRTTSIDFQLPSVLLACGLASLRFLVVEGDLIVVCFFVLLLRGRWIGFHGSGKEVRSSEDVSAPQVTINFSTRCTWRRLGQAQAGPVWTRDCCFSWLEVAG
jgi:hypothetical protein